MNLSEDLTGLTVSSVKMDDQNCPSYNCILQDCLGKVGALNFKLSFRDDGMTVYDPDLEPGRDAPILAVLPDELQRYRE